MKKSAFLFLSSISLVACGGELAIEIPTLDAGYYAMRIDITKDTFAGSYEGQTFNDVWLIREENPYVYELDLDFDDRVGPGEWNGEAFHWERIFEVGFPCGSKSTFQVWLTEAEDGKLVGDSLVEWEDASCDQDYYRQEATLTGTLQ